MFVNINSNGKYEYVRILETYYESGKHKQRVLANLGRRDQIGANLAKIAQDLAKLSEKPMVTLDDLGSGQALTCGGVMLARHFYEKLGLDNIVRSHCSTTRQKFDVAERVFVLLANRLTEPRSEHGLARWLENAYVCDGDGRRWLPEWRPVEEITPDQRVRVQHRQLQKWYRTLDALLGGRKEIEKQLYLRVRDLFSLEVDMVFYDVTNAHFARRSPKGRLRRHGKPKNGMRRNVLVTLGVVMANGWPIAHHIFPGNTADKKTFQSAVKDVENRFGLRRVLVVSDAGMVSPENVEFLSAEGREVHYLMGMPGRKSEEASSVFERLDEERWIEVGRNNRVQEICLENPNNTRYFVVESDERKEYEQELRQRDMDRVGKELQKTQAAVEAGRLCKPEKVGARAARVLARHHGNRYYSWEIREMGGDDGQTFHYYEDPAKLATETIREGRYIIKSNDARIQPEESVKIYKQLSDVESAYRDLKDVLDMRPIHHKTDQRVEAHIFVATLGLFVKRTLDEHLKQNDIYLTSTEAFEAMKSVGASELNIDGQKHVIIRGGSRDAQRVMKVLGMENPSFPPVTLGAETPRN